MCSSSTTARGQRWRRTRSRRCRSASRRWPRRRKPSSARWAFPAAPEPTGGDDEAGDDDADDLATRAVEFVGDEANGKDLTQQVLGSERGTGQLFVALYDDGGAGAMAVGAGAMAVAAAATAAATAAAAVVVEEKKVPALHLPTSSSSASDSRPPEDGAASPWGTTFAWGPGSSNNNNGMNSSSNSSSNAGDTELEDTVGRTVSEMSLGDIIAAEDAAAAAAIKATTGGVLLAGERVVSVNEALLAQGLARLSRSAGRYLRRGGGPKKSWTALSSALHEHLLEAEGESRRAHRNRFRHGDPPESEDERDNRERVEEGSMAHGFTINYDALDIPNQSPHSRATPCTSRRYR